jgi:hypothetical protein
MCENLTVRRAIKQGSGIPTIPVSTSHQNGDWIPTDIYAGEMYQDTDTGIVYTRNGNDIETVGGGQGQPKIWKAQIEQTGTSAPVLTVLVNTLGVTVTSNYIGVGEYEIDGFAHNLAGLIDINLTTGYDRTYLNALTIQTSSILDIKSYISGTLSNNVFNNSGANLGTCILTITKYD